MKQCDYCDDEFSIGKRGQVRLQEHFERFHREPILNKDGTIQINAVHQICLVLKGDDSWDNQLRKEVKKKDESAIRGIIQLQKFEKEHNVQFGHCDNSDFFIQNYTTNRDDLK